MHQLLNTQRMVYERLDISIQTWIKKFPEDTDLLVSLRDALGLQAKLIARQTDQLHVLEREVMRLMGYGSNE